MTVAVDALPTEFKAFKQAVHALGGLLLQRRLFPGGHPAVERVAGEAHEQLLVFMGGRDRVTFRIVRHAICHLNFEIDVRDRSERTIHLLRETLRRLSIGELEITRGIERNELLAVADILLGTIRKDESVDLVERWSRIRHVRIRNGDREETPTAPIAASRSLVPVAGGKENEPRRETEMSHIIDGVLGKLDKFRSREGSIAGRTIRHIVERGGETAPVILFLNSLKAYDDYTFAHSVNVAVISTAVARHLGFPEDEIDRVGLAALLHDIGKLHVPRSIIHKAGRLTPAEWLIVKKHPVDGERLLAEEGIEPRVRRVAYEHHMRYDDGGYPRVEEGYEQLPASHIVRIADTYDALTTKRAYRKQLSPYEAIRMMERTRGTEFHPKYLDAFLRVLGNIPIGSVVRLNTGEKAVVVEMKAGSGSLPTVRLIAGDNGEGLRHGEIVDLGAEKADGRRLAAIEEDSIRDVDVGRYLVET